MMAQWQAADGCTQLWLTENDTLAWASRPGASWPCSTLAGRRLWAKWDAKGDLVDVEASDILRGIDGVEFTAITSDFLREKYGPDHPAIRGS